MSKPPVLVLAILDGWGLSTRSEGNAIALAQTPTLDMLYSRFPWVSLNASGPAVGLPEGQMGNSEVGHLNIGVGRVAYQDITQIDRAIESGDFFRNAALTGFLEAARGRSLHLLGLVSDGGVHSHIRHLFALLRLAKQMQIARVFIHAFTDGRDTYPRAGIDYLRAVRDQAREIGLGQIASISGRYYAMDRDKRWERTEKAYRAIVDGIAANIYSDPLHGVQESYAENVTDEFIVPFCVGGESGRPLGTISSDDAIIFFNFRADRARQMTHALTDPVFEPFSRPAGVISRVLTMSAYDRNFNLPVAFAPVRLERTMVKLFGELNLRNLRLAETEKYAHVTYFFNGGEEQLFPGEERILIPSPKVATYDLKPEMSAVAITDRLFQELDRKFFQTVIMNFANADMVGHTGVLQATVKAVETVDQCLHRIFKKCRELGAILVVTADHGNAEQMIDPLTGNVHTAHTTNPVPFILVDPHYTGKLRPGGALKDIAPTMLKYLQIKKPHEMTGEPLFLTD
ncbi:MAG: 2,3-bisphosphoglycerate-independent phosphoglycerate mutase [Acidobacteria bacterium]|nr:2,3-bisphosphoglycerate-independent phosphoglycerate mutase [Acidobacteriota bacterium]